MSKKYLVTGGNGFIGSSIIKQLLQKKNNKIISFDSNLRGNIEKLGDSKKKIKIITADIRNLNALIKASKGVDCLIHLAFLNGTKNFYDKPDLVLDIGAKGMNYLARTKSAEILGEAQRKQSDYQSRLGAMSKIGGAYAGSAIENRTWTPWKG